MKNWWKKVVVNANSKGIPLPMVRYKDEGNPALTLVFISAALVTIGIVGKWSGHLGGIDMNAAMEFFYASSTLFFGHSWVHKRSLDLPESDEKHDDKGPV
jgi:hypothetical protein